MQTTNHHSPQAMAHGLASLGRYGDTYMVHAAEGETVIPAEILLANPRLKADLFRQMQMMGIKNPGRYVVGNTLNSLNPVTGQPEFFWKRLRHLAPAFGAAIGRSVLGPLGAPLGAAGTAALVDEDPLKWGLGTLAADVAGQGISGAVGADTGFGNRLAGFGRGLTRGATAPFRALGNLFTVGPENPVAQGSWGPTFMPESARRFRELYPDQNFLSPYRTGSDIEQRIAALTPRNRLPMGSDRGYLGGPQEGRDSWRAYDAGFTSGDPSKLRQLMKYKASTDPVSGQTVYSSPDASGFIPEDVYQKAVRLHSSGPLPSLEEVTRLAHEGILTEGMTIKALGPGGYEIDYVVPAEKQTFMESLKSPSTLGSAAAFTIPAGLAYFAARGDEDEGDLSPEELRERQKSVDPQRVAYDEAAGPSPEAGIRPAFAYQGEEGIRRLARSMGISMDAARRYVGGYGSQYLAGAGGGEIMGPGTGTSDSIPARLSDGEFVMTADAVRGAGNGSRDLGAARMYDLMSRFEGLS